ncbi:MAG: hypothetical protein KGL21_03785, partial [Alphaproteobacteria bacterium]|nr:hypothetical protein [Alphaproteobacteria bacterium]
YNSSDQAGAAGAATPYSVMLAGNVAANPALISGTAALACSGGDASCTNVGSYNVAIGGLYSGQLGYDLISGTGTSAALTITPATLTITYTATPASNVGAYAITQGTLMATPNYGVSYVGAQLQVKAAGQTLNDFLTPSSGTSGSNKPGEGSQPTVNGMTSCTPDALSNDLRNQGAAQIGMGCATQ